MRRSIVIGGIAGACIGAVGYDAEYVVRGTATLWNYGLGCLGLIGLIAVWRYVSSLRKRRTTLPRVRDEN